MTTTTARKSRASRAADKAAQDQQQPEPQDQQQPGPADPPDENSGPSSDTRDREDQDQQQPEQVQQPQPESEAKPEPEPTPGPTPEATPKPAKAPAKPTATFDLGERPVIYRFPTLTLADGTVVECPHSSYGHEAEKPAMACLRKLAAEHGAVLAKP